MKITLNRREMLGTTVALAVPAAANLGGSHPRAINFVDTGRSHKPTILFIHGYGCSLNDWSFQLEGLAETHRCVAMDLPGHGKTPRSKDASIAAMAEAVITIIQELKLDRATLVGHSMGCRVVSEVYSQIPDQIGGIVWLDGSILASDNPAESINRISETIDKMGIAAFFERSYSDFFFSTTPASVRERIKAEQPDLNADPIFWRDLFVDMVRYDETRSRDVLKAIKVPALVVQSTILNAEVRRAPMTPTSVTPWMEEVAKTVKNARIERVLGSGHFVMLEKSEQINQLLGHFPQHLNR